MLGRTALRAPAATAMIARRGFHSTRAQMGSPYHYPEGPRSNIPFNPLTKFFYLRYWAFMGASSTERLVLQVANEMVQLLDSVSRSVSPVSVAHAITNLSRRFC